MTAVPPAAARLEDVEVVRDGRTILAIDRLEIGPGGHLAVLGPNGSGKTTLLRLLSTYLHPTRGQVEVLGARFGRTDLRALRDRVGMVSVSMHRLLQTTALAADLVAAAGRGATRVVPGVTADERERATRSLARVGAAHLADRSCRTLSQGEWQRVQIARALVLQPGLLLLDEPFAGLDVGGRESLVADLAAVLSEAGGPTVVLVTHHLEELPIGIRDALLLRDGGVVASGAAERTLTSATVSEAFDIDLDVDRRDGRYAARVRHGVR